ncbi:MAG: efflux transporter outer membrane subunit [Limisphaerales bacterium]
MKSLRPFLLSLLCVGTACQTVTERMVPDADEETPEASGDFRYDTTSDSEAVPEDWWKVFGDSTLTELIGRLNDANPDVAAALARVDQSFAILGITRSSIFPTGRANAEVGRRRDSQNNLLFPINQLEYDRFSVGLSATWEVDLWGRVRATVKRDRLRAQGEAVNYRNVLLSLQASLAEQYFAYRAAQTELNLLLRAESLAEEALAVQRARLELGQGVQADVAKAKLELQTSAAATEAAHRNSGKLLHSLATLTGTMPSKLTELKGQGGGGSVEIPAGVPSELLGRRPDLMVADRSLRAAAQQIGISKADFLPKLTLVGSGAVASLRAENWFEADSGLFDVGPQVDVPIFAYKLRKNRVAEAKAAYQEAAANYRSAFLTAVREVDDALLDLRSFEREAKLQRAALDAATEAATAAKDRYERGLDSYLEYIGAEQVRLQTAAREKNTSAQGQIASVHLIRALGGSWGSLEE